MTKLGASYDIRLRLGNHPVEAGDDAVTTGGVFTDVSAMKRCGTSHSSSIDRGFS
jgi:hypothetical protein